MKVNGQTVAGIQQTDHQFGEAHFSHSGCDNCNNSLGNDVHACKVYVFTPANQNINQSTNTYIDDDYYEMDLCHSCLCAYHNGDELDEQCNNAYDI